jgi:methionine synthase I (cobalamin-dependent)
VTDGAWGTQLQQRGLEVGACPDAWNLTHPERVEEVARAYVEAGSQVILTNTFGANRFILARHGLADQVAAVNRAGVEISRRAAAEGVRVFASLGPSGVMLMMGQVSEDELRAAFADQARAMADAGADGIVVETMSDPAEAALAVAAARETGVSVVACMTFDSGANKDRTMMGTTPEQAAEKLLAAGADLVGANCGQGIAGFVAICRRLHSASGRPVWVKANAGLPQIQDGKTVYTQTPEEFASYVPELVQSGAGFLGGCCGTSPEFIRAVAARMKADRGKPAAGRSSARWYAGYADVKLSMDGTPPDPPADAG